MTFPLLIEHLSPKIRRAMCAAEYHNRGGVPRTADNRCALGVAMKCLGYEYRPWYDTPTAATAACKILRVAEGPEFYHDPVVLDGTYSALGNECAEFIIQFDEGQLTGEKLCQALGVGEEEDE